MIGTWVLPASSGPRPDRCPTAASGWSIWGSRLQPSRVFCCSMSRSRGWPPPNASASAAGQEDVDGHSGPARRARYRPRVPPCRPGHRHERRPGAAWMAPSRTPVRPSACRRSISARVAHALAGKARPTAAEPKPLLDSRQDQHLLRQEPYPHDVGSTCAKRRSWRCSAATARASRRCSRSMVGIVPPATGSIRLAGDELARQAVGQNRPPRRRLRASRARTVRRHDAWLTTWNSVG